MNDPVATLRVAYSPDADDAFMYFGLTSGAVADERLSVQLGTDDIQSLNEAASRGSADVSAISFAAWPSLAATHDLLAVGSSFGLGVGPKLVAPSAVSLAELAGRRVAVPGLQTTAALLLRMASPDVSLLPVPFDRVAETVLAGRAEAGVVIHEGQLTHEREGLRLVLDLGRWWSDETGGLPTPLGANAVRREVPRESVRRFSELLARSIRHAWSHRPEALRESRRHARGLTDAEIDAFVRMYVNDLSVDPGESGREAVAELYGRAGRAGLLPEIAPRWA